MLADDLRNFLMCRGGRMDEVEEQRVRRVLRRTRRLWRHARDVARFGGIGEAKAGWIGDRFREDGTDVQNRSAQVTVQAGE